MNRFDDEGAIFGQFPNKIGTLSIEPEAESCFRRVLAEQSPAG